MNARENLESRWRPEWNAAPAFRRISTAYGLAMKAYSAIDAATAQRDKLAKAGELSPKGINERQRTFAQGEAIPPFRRAAHMVDKAVAEIKATRAGLAVGRPDPTDAAGSIKRVDMRAWLRTMKPHEVIAALLAPDVDPDLLLATYEVPAGMTGLSNEQRDQVEKAIVERTHETELQVINDLQEAAAVVDAMIGLGMQDLAKVVGFDSTGETGFEAWVSAASAPVDRQIADEARGSPIDTIDLSAAVDVIQKMNRDQLDKVTELASARRLTLINATYDRAIAAL